MISRLNKIVQIMRDVPTILVSVFAILVIYFNNIRTTNAEPAHYIFAGFLIILSILTLVNLLLIIIRVESKIYFYINSILQLMISLPILGFAGRIPAMILVAFNIVILVTLRKNADVQEKKRKALLKINKPVSKLNKILQFARDFLLLGICAVIFIRSFEDASNFPVRYTLIGIASLVILLVAINILLLLMNIKRRWYFYAFTILQIMPLAIFSRGPLVFFTVPILILDIAILITLRKKKG